MRRERKSGLIFSGILHAVAVLLLIVGLPSLLPHHEPEPMALTVDIVPISTVTNIKPSEEEPRKEEKREAKKEEAKKPAPPTLTSSAKYAPPAKAEEPKPAPPEPKPSPEPKPIEKPKAPEPKPEKKLEPKPEKKPKEDDLMAVLKSVQAKAEQEEKKKPEKTQKPAEAATSAAAHSNVPYNPNVPISLSVKDAIRQQLYKCWSMPAGVKDAQSLIVTVDLWLNRDGSLIDVRPTTATAARMAGDLTYRVAAERAIRAVHECSPLQHLPPDKYEGWSYMQFTFDPSESLY